MVFLSIQNISISFGKTTALDNISINLEKGEYVVVLGPSGSGKTSLLKVVSGLYTPDSGKVLVNSKEITHLAPEERSVAFMPQTYALFNKMNVWQNVTYGPELQQKSKSEIETICNTILELVHLENRKTAYPDELSGGMKQRTALARALATNFPILLLDEPLRALDARLRIELRTELRRIVKELGFTALHVTHDQNEAMAIADRILILHEGKIVQIGTQAEIYFNPATVFVTSFMDEINHLEGFITKKEPIKNMKSQDGIEINYENHKYYMYSIETTTGYTINSFSDKELELKDLVDLIIKGESIRVKKHHKKDDVNNDHDNKDKKDNKGNFSGHLVAKYFLGNWSKLRIENEKFSWVIKLPSIRAERYEINDHLEISFKLSSVILLQKGLQTKSGVV